MQPSRLPNPSIITTAIVGRLGPIALGAVGISNMCMNLTMMLFRFLTVVTTPAVAKAIAKNDLRKVWLLYSHGVVVYNIVLRVAS